MVDSRRGAKFAANCLECGEGFDDFVTGLGIGNRIEPLRVRRNEWMNDHAVATGHQLFEYSDTVYRRVELLGGIFEKGLNP